MNGRIVFVDVETGGVEPHHPDIQIAAVAVNREMVEIDSFEAKIQFDVAKCDPEALELNSFDPDVWLHFAKPESMVVADFGAFLRKHATLERISKKNKPYKVARLAGHYAARFHSQNRRTTRGTTCSASGHSWDRSK